MSFQYRRIENIFLSTKSISETVLPALSLLENDHLNYDPFLIFEHIGPIKFLPEEAFGSIDHPHKGLHILTYVAIGSILHGISIAKSPTLINSGEVQYIFTGSGIMHYEIPNDELLIEGGVLEAFQIWINCPNANKNAKPFMQKLNKSDLSIVRTEGNFSEIIVIAGQALGVSSSLEFDPSICFLDIKLEKQSNGQEDKLVLDIPGSEFETTLVYVWNCYPIVSSSGVLIVQKDGSKLVQKDSVASFSPDGNEIVFKLQDTSMCRLLLLAGKKLSEPVCKLGPFAMPTRQLAHQAVIDYQAGAFGQVDEEATARRERNDLALRKYRARLQSRDSPAD